ncbi:MAG: 50S ribosomal protein L15e [Candidatus Nanoarchaeia archaeon]
MCIVQGLYHKLRELWKKPGRELVHEKMIQWRAGNAAVVVDKPLRLDRARALGYKAKKGFVVVRIRVNRGGRTRSRHTHGRKSRKQRVRKVLKMSYQWVAETRAANKFKNLEVLNSYNIGRDGKHYFFEVIMIDPDKPEIKKDKNYSWIVKGENRKRASRGLTSAAKKSRGLRSKSPKLKVRPSLRARGNLGK